MELIFETRDAEEGGLYARALGHSIFTEAEPWDELPANVLDAGSGDDSTDRKPPLGKALPFARPLYGVFRSRRCPQNCASSRARLVSSTAAITRS